MNYLQLLDICTLLVLKTAEEFIVHINNNINIYKGLKTKQNKTNQKQKQKQNYEKNN